MLAYIFRRVLASAPELIGLAFNVYTSIPLSQTHLAVPIDGDMATPEQLAQIRQSLGLNEPLVTQFITWSGQLLSGDFGRSLISRTPVLTLIGQRLEPTLSLALVTMAITLLLSIPMGVLAAWRHGTLTDNVIMAISVLGFSIPVFVTGYIFIQIFAIDLKLLPVQGFKSIFDGVGPFLARIILPAFTLATIYIALIARMTRAAMLDVLDEDYVRTARAKGLSERIVLFRHALRNAAVPILTVVGTGFALMISGVVVTESVFNIPGLGRLTVDAILARDYPVIQALILLTSGIYVVINLLIDISYAFMDPRIRY